MARKAKFPVEARALELMYNDATSTGITMMLDDTTNQLADTALEERLWMLRELRRKMLADDTISGATLILRGETIYVSRAGLLRQPVHADA